jgi:hypothetical protein
MKKEQHVKFWLGLMAVLAIVVSSCKKEAIENDALSAIPSSVQSDLSVHLNLDLYWGNWSDGTYTSARAVSDFGNISDYSSTEESRCYVIYEALRVKLIKNAQDAISGVVARIDVADHSRYTLTYDVKVGDTFDWAQVGGKLGFGFLIGQGYTGGASTQNGDGASFRLAWGVSGGDAYFRPYVYYVDQPGVYGSSFGARYPATGSLSKNTWYTIALYTRSNTYANSDGSISMKVNGTTILSDGSFRWTTVHAQRLVNNLAWACFRGGGTGSESPTDGYAYFDNLHLEYMPN